ncbi:hypothetical protein E3P89_01486 [Wallemia ichthyophaga]|uniref:AN1-type domain-containing protein n=1 Tax=Wallemia ichthyophaga TaxID=245174 RepID=A0A4T0HFA3_WALIC|nr:hypothetical protein E3P96_02805 [Wallemia ichthyophaga]TIB12792.1 hypothetical protein E3P90_01928 [Wallemia ichthyophaga]TIB14379.1 hypothetical protein E3P93_01678 [Wallemia ichthyophaga]TIB23573.1 hypothetical protein E3P89_01486 [Wallemia ichthyophaga]TIB24863.1 hypothetical protein E3P88_01883 [Wallemia ichthyophaga]
MSFSPSEQKPEAEREEGLLDIGSKCSTLNCPNIDYLIHECTKCHRRYCSEHRSAVFDCCQRQSTQKRDKTHKVFVACTLPCCSSEAFSGSEYCLAHRHHAAPIQTAQKGSVSKQQASKLDAIRAKFGKTTPMTPSTGGTATKTMQHKPIDRRVWMMKTRMNAKPLREHLDSNHRVHISVSLSQSISHVDINLDSCSFFYLNKSLSMGRVLDLLADKLSVDSSEYYLYHHQQQSNTKLNLNLNLSAAAGDIPGLDCAHLILVQKAGVGE